MTGATADEKHGATLTVVNAAPFYSMVRLFCSCCLADLRHQSTANTFDCRSGELCGCGARYCSLRCLVSHKHHACTEIQMHLCRLASSCFMPKIPPSLEKPSARTKLFGFDGTVQWYLLKADLENYRAASCALEAAVSIFTKAKAPALANLVADRLHPRYPGRRLQHTLRPPPSVYRDWFKIWETALAFFHVISTNRVNKYIACLYYTRSWVYYSCLRNRESIDDLLYARQLFRELYGEASLSVAFCFYGLETVYMELPDRRHRAHEMRAAVDYIVDVLNTPLADRPGANR